MGGRAHTAARLKRRCKCGWRALRGGRGDGRTGACCRHGHGRMLRTRLRRRVQVRAAGTVRKTGGRADGRMLQHGEEAGTGTGVTERMA